MTGTILSFLKRKLRTKVLSFENGPCSCDFCLMARSMIQKDSKLAIMLRGFPGDSQKNCKFSYLNDTSHAEWLEIPGTSSCKANSTEDITVTDQTLTKYVPENFDEVWRKLMFVEAELQKSRRLLKKKSKQQFVGVLNGMQISQRVIDDIEQLDRKRKELRRDASNLRQRVRVLRKESSLQSIQNQKSYKMYPVM